MWISLSISLNCRYILHKTYTGVDGTTLFGANAEVVATRAAAAKISFTMLGNLEDKVVRYWHAAGKGILAKKHVLDRSLMGIKRGKDTEWGTSRRYRTNATFVHFPVINFICTYLISQQVLPAFQH